MYEIDTQRTLGLMLSGGKRKSSGREIVYTCPFCGHKDKLSFSIEKKVGQCWHCGWKGSVASLYAELHGLNVTNKSEIYKMIAQEGYNGYIPKSYPRKEVPKEAPLASIEERDRTYTELLQSLTLTQTGYTELRKRGLSDADIRRNMYRSTENIIDGGEKIISELLRKNCVLKGVPGFYRDEKGWRFVWVAKGIFIPVRDEYARIQGMQFRMYKQEEEKLKDKKIGKYIWISSAGKKDGAGSSTPVHFACNRVEILGKNVPAIPKQGNGKKIFLLTEGPLKADVAHALCPNMDFIAVPGVACLNHLGRALAYLKANGCEYIADAFDMDYITNDNVKKASEKIREMIKEAGMTYIRFEWSSDAKGIDDYLLKRKTR